MKNRMTYIDLFSGSGGFSLGFDRKGFQNIFSIDNEPSFCETYRHNFPNHRLIEKDICQLSEPEIRLLIGNTEVDAVIGGPPCQGFSIAGNIGRKFIDDPRNRLFKEFVRVVKIVRPKFFVMENVARLYNHNKGETRKEIIRDFEELGYRVECKILNSADYDVPQVRKRVIFIGSRSKRKIEFPKKITEQYRTVKEAIHHYPTLAAGEESIIPNHVAMTHSRQMLEKMSYVSDGGSRAEIPVDLRPTTGDVRKYIRYKSNEPSVCVTGDMRKIFHYSQNRALTVRELAKLQTYPDDFIFKGSKISQQQQVGNSVPPQMAEAIAGAIIKMNRDVKYPKVNYIGNKEKIAGWICDQFPKDAKTVFDAFSGGCSLSYEAKLRNMEVYTNDILKVNYHIANALIRNNNTRLDQADLELIFGGTPVEGFMFENYANVFFFPDECKELDLYRNNIEKLDSEEKKSLALTLMRRAMIRKMPYSRFTINWDKILQLRDEEFSYLKYKRKRAYHNQSFKEHFLENVNEYNQAVFDNAKNNVAYNADIFELVETVEADIIYLDPPYTGTMNNYFGFYGLIDDYITSTKTEPFENNFLNKSEAIALFDRLFSKLNNFKYWFLSYNNASYPSKEELLSLLNKYCPNVQVIEKKHNYQITGKTKKEDNKEFLFIAKNDNRQSKTQRVIMQVQNYEEYWKLTNAFTDYNGRKFIDTLAVCIEFIDEYQGEPYSEDKYARLQHSVLGVNPINLISIRKSINQLVKMGFINSFLLSYHPLAKEYVEARTNKKRETLLSKIIYSNSSFNRAVNNDSSTRQINFLIQTLIENGSLSREEIIALMLVDIDAHEEPFISGAELQEYVKEATYIGFIKRKYNQVAYLYNLLGKLDDLVFVGDNLYFKEDAHQIFGEELSETVKKRDPYLHRLYKNQLQDECREIYGRLLCVVERLPYPVLIASHIKPFAQSDENEAYDPDNGLLLSKTIDSLFDLKYISFTDEGKIIFSKRVPSDVAAFWAGYHLEPPVLNEKRRRYLAFHRELMAAIDNRTV